MDDYRALIQNMENEESRLLAQRIADSQLRLKQTKALVALGGILGFLITAAAAWSAQRDKSTWPRGREVAAHRRKTVLLGLGSRGLRDPDAQFGGPDNDLE